MLLAVDPARLADLRWERSRDDALFPHLYGPLELDAVAGGSTARRARRRRRDRRPDPPVTAPDRLSAASPLAVIRRPRSSVSRGARHDEAAAGRRGDEPARVVEDLGLGERDPAAGLDDRADRPQGAAFPGHRPGVADVEVNRRVADARLEGGPDGQRRHRVGDGADQPAVHHAEDVVDRLVGGAREHHPARLGLDRAEPEQQHQRRRRQPAVDQSPQELQAGQAGPGRRRQLRVVPGDGLGPRRSPVVVRPLRHAARPAPA